MSNEPNNLSHYRSAGVWELDKLCIWANEHHTLIDKEWVPTRPVDHKYRTFQQRLQGAWLAYTGKVDLVRWPKGQ